MEALGQLTLLDRRRVRETFEKRFSAERMAGDYLAVYAGVVAAKAGRLAALSGPSEPAATPPPAGGPSPGSPA